jgi:hypothetical protein
LGIKLVVKICALLGLVAIVEMVFLLSPLNVAAMDNTFLDAWGVKHDQLVAPGQNRLIIAGGSSSAFGIDSGMLESSTGRKTINLGLHAGLGLAVMLNEVEDGARSGDLVVLVPEYELFFDDHMNGDLPATQLLQHDRSALKYFSSWRQWRSLLRNTPVLTSATAFALISRARMAVLSQPPGLAAAPTVYRSDAFDLHGDMVAHLHEQSRPDRVVANAEPIRGEFNPQAIDAIARCARILAARGVEFVLIYPAVADAWWAINRDRAEQVASRLPVRPALLGPEDWVFDNNLFFDTPYHLNARGRKQRTERLTTVLHSAGTELHPNPTTIGAGVIDFTIATP